MAWWNGVCPSSSRTFTSTGSEGDIFVVFTVVLAYVGLKVFLRRREVALNDDQNDLCILIIMAKIGFEFYA